MKKWNITIEAKDEADALKLIKILTDTFETAAKFELPLHHLSANLKGALENEIICNEVNN